jgi:hypothetical protein
VSQKKATATAGEGKPVKSYPRINFRVSDAEQAEIEAAAKAEGLTPGAYLRRLAVDSPKTRPIRRPLPAEILLRQLKAAASKVDSNLAQFLKLANRGEPVPLEEIADAANAVRDFYIHALVTLKEN